MPLALRITVIAAIFWFSAGPAFSDNDIAYRYTDTDPDDDVEDEYFDAYGKRIYDADYREKHRIQSERMQQEASKPFGLAGQEFGKSWGTASLKKEASPSPSPALEDQGSAAEIEQEKEEDNDTLVPSRKPRVLVG